MATKTLLSTRKKSRSCGSSFLWTNPTRAPCHRVPLTHSNVWLNAELPRAKQLVPRYVCQCPGQSILETSAMSQVKLHEFTYLQVGVRDRSARRGSAPAWCSIGRLRRQRRAVRTRRIRSGCSKTPRRATPITDMERGTRGGNRKTQDAAAGERRTVNGRCWNQGDPETVPLEL